MKDGMPSSGHFGHPLDPAIVDKLDEAIRNTSQELRGKWWALFLECYRACTKNLPRQNYVAEDRQRELHALYSASYACEAAAQSSEWPGPWIRVVPISEEVVDVIETSLFKRAGYPYHLECEWWGTFLSGIEEGQKPDNAALGACVEWDL